MKWIEDDGGRKAAGFKGDAGDCVCRAVAIATGKPYKEIYEEIAKLNKDHGRPASARNGLDKDLTKIYLNSLGFKWKATMKIGQGCKVHMREEELPSGTIIVKLSKHIACVKDKVLHDTYDCSRDGTRCVYGYWYKEDLK
jgi:hypothetical protein